ncbi:MAG: hypothetical protein AAF517_05905 [Planctomycetota bacterium]
MRTFLFRPIVSTFWWQRLAVLLMPFVYFATILSHIHRPRFCYITLADELRRWVLSPGWSVAKLFWPEWPRTDDSTAMLFLTVFWANLVFAYGAIYASGWLVKRKARSET